MENWGREKDEDKPWRDILFRKIIIIKFSKMYKCGQKQQKRAAPGQEIVWVGAGSKEGEEGRRGSQSTMRLQEINCLQLQQLSSDIPECPQIQNQASMWLHTGNLHTVKLCFLHKIIKNIIVKCASAYAYKLYMNISHTQHNSFCTEYSKKLMEGWYPGASQSVMPDSIMECHIESWLCLQSRSLIMHKAAGRRDRSSTHVFTPQMAPRAGTARAEPAQSQDLAGLVYGCKGPSTWAILHCFLGS